MSKELLNKLKEYLKGDIEDLYKVVNVIKSKDSNYNIHYITICLNESKTPEFKYKTNYKDLRVFFRDFLIDDILTGEKIDFDDFGVEEVIYNKEQKEKLEKLRSDKKDIVYSFGELYKAKKEWSESFKLGQRVYYKGEHGIITFKHNKKNQEDIQKYSVKVGLYEYRYVYGTDLSNREVKDLSYIPIDKKLNKLPTNRLLKMYKRSLKLNKGLGNLKIKRILQEREHIQNSKTIIINVK